MSCKQVFRSKILLAGLILLSFFMFACENPFDPLKESADIKGLSYIDWSGTWDRWDSDPEYDGFSITMEYYNQYGDSLEFKDKAHQLKVEFWAQKEINMEIDPNTNEPVPGTGEIVRDRLIFTFETTFSNSDDDIRIPKELYTDILLANGYKIEEVDTSVFIIVRVFPPKAQPQQELEVGYPDQLVYKPTTDVTPNP